MLVGSYDGGNLEYSLLITLYSQKSWKMIVMAWGK